MELNTIKEMKEPKDIIINGKTLAEIIEAHKHWLYEDCEGWQDMKANLRGANLSDVEYNENAAFFALQCPEEGAYIGWKKANGHIVKLRITEDAKRSSATTRKCRASKAEVLEIQNIDGSKAYVDFVLSNHDSSFVYKVGEIVAVADFDENRWNESSTGIHHFITRKEAVNY